MQKKKTGKIVFILFFLLVSNVLFAQTTPKIDLRLKNATLKDFFVAITAGTKCPAVLVKLYESTNQIRICRDNGICHDCLR